MPSSRRKKGESRSRSPNGGRSGSRAGRASPKSNNKQSGGGQSFDMLHSLVNGFSRTAAAKFTSQLGDKNDKEDRDQRGQYLVTDKPTQICNYHFHKI